MRKETQTFADDYPFEILVSYKWEDSEPFEAEPGNPGTRVPGLRETELTSVEVVIKGRGIDILTQLTDKEKQTIIEHLNYE